MALRVAFNATPLLSPLTGIGNYIVHLGEALAETGEVDAYSFYGGGWQHGAPAPPAPGGPRASVARVRDAVKPFVPFKREIRGVRQQWLFRRGMRRQAIELYHEPNYAPFDVDVPVVITIHDLSWIRHPQTHPSERVRWLDRAMPSAAERADAILVVSKFTRQEVLTTLGVDARRVHVTHLGVAPAYHPRNAVETVTTLQGLGLIHGGYVLTVGTREPRKNLPHILEAYAALPAAIRARYPLVVAGARGWFGCALERRLRWLASSGQIRFLGHVSNGDLAMLYAGAATFVFPSLYEGFGLPPLEAMASGVPVLVSDRASLPEIIGDAGLLLDPDRPDLTATLLATVLDDAPSRADMAARGLRRAADFTWQACARATLDVYRRVLETVPRA